MDAIRSLVQPLVGPSTVSSAGMIDGMKLVVLGGTVATARKMGSRAWNHFVNSFFLTAHFSEDDYPYDWLMLWLSRRPEWQRSREFETTTRLATPLSGGSNSSSSRTADNSFGDEDYRECYDGDDVPGKVKTRVVFQPTFDTTHTIYYRGHWLRVRRWRKGDDMGMLIKTSSYSVVARSNTILKQLVLQAKREYEAEAIHRIQIYFADSHGGWRWTDSRHKRPMSSIVLNPGYKEMLLSDTKDFLNSEKWYADRGIPFRRGYLLHGVPGSGKSSLIHAIAGELMLDIYALSLSAAWINDATLTTLMGRVPARCIVLLEDLDAAFTRSTGRHKSKSDSNNNSSGTTTAINSGSSSRRRRTGTSGINGGANTTDALSEASCSMGVPPIRTTNHLDHLDPALSRPGRMDVWIDFKNASKWQAEALFRNFFPSAVGAVTGSAPRSRTASSPSVPRANSSASPQRLPQSKTQRQHTHSPAPLSPSVLSKLAQEFAQKVPDEEFSVAALQGYLLRNKSRPEEAVKGVEAWVEEERRNKEKQKGGKGKGKGSDEERKKRREQRKERREKKKKSNEQSIPKAVPPEPEANTKKTKSKSKSKSRKSKSASKSDDNHGSDSDSSSLSSTDSESSSNSDSDSDSSSDSSSDDDDENTDPRPRQSTTSMARSPPSPPIPSYDWSVEPTAWEATPANGGWGKGW
ncbi:P-loop containing nucleoside triphosphate hydrolase protein [Lentinula lateritia]|uniref:P-loop containing nucleoside triphosphate hydrolase protein n=1 Tax=Lentinula aff. lateritia TaxID=2804960 RepID=A0ACC1TSC6_9AGAR|nr:P-loop containing nucleoside triphosphate hydrolase protein [Lentinula aff. lateritia]KAJ3852076.1 P-loop containing nucleoside triphosphate hydrolase protein [Lentinula lateritia]